MGEDWVVREVDHAAIEQTEDVGEREEGKWEVRCGWVDGVAVRQSV